MADRSVSAAAGEPPMSAVVLRAAGSASSCAGPAGPGVHRRVYDADTLLDLMGTSRREAVKVFPSVQWRGHRRVRCSAVHHRARDIE